MSMCQGMGWKRDVRGSAASLPGAGWSSGLLPRGLLHYCRVNHLDKEVDSDDCFNLRTQGSTHSCILGFV